MKDDNLLLQLIRFFGKMLQDKGEPSSKRGAGFLLLFYFIIADSTGDPMPFDDKVLILGSALTALGMAMGEKFRKNNPTAEILQN